MKYFSFLLIFPLLAVILGSSIVMAESNEISSQPTLTQVSPQYYAQRLRRGRQGRIMQQLNLSDEQTQQLVNIRQKYQQKIQPIRQKIQSSRQELNQLMAEDVSNNVIRTKHQEISQLREQLVNLHFESMLEMRQVLTPEQRREFAQLMEERRENFRQRGPRNFNAPDASMDEPDDVMP